MKRSLLLLVASLGAAATVSACAGWIRPRPAPEAESTQGMVVSAHPLASAAGVEVLRRGGNAVDAAVAAAFALSVVEPYSSGLGGGGFMLIYPGPGREVAVLDYREVAPAKASREMYQKDGRVAPGLSTTGHLAVAVPGTVAGLAAALERYGTMPLSRALEPAIRLAEDGFRVSLEFEARDLATWKKLKLNDAAAKIFLRRGLPYQVGQTLKQPDLAKTLRAVAAGGPQVFYRGWIADAIADDMAGHGGLITRADLAAYQPRWRQPVAGSYRGFQVVSMPPPSSGGVILLEMLNVLEGYDLAGMGFHSVETEHLLAETMRFAFADRAAFLGDPAFVKIPLDRLLSKEYADFLRESLRLDRATPSREIKRGNLLPAESQTTTHLSVVDKNGGAVALTQTINTLFGAGVAAPGTGILLNDEMDDFAADPGQPNAYGLVQGEANAVAPGKVPLSSMSPTLVFKDGKLFLVVGSPGGPRIITTVLQVILNVADFGMNLPEAVAAPRLHHQWLPDQLYLEAGRLSFSERRALEKKGHTLKRYVLPGNAQAILVAPDGSLVGASDPRGEGRPEPYLP
jgi:gamma-glutamyltranspeptidase/glutathione hydrolase